jgi:hypothetical protein
MLLNTSLFSILSAARQAKVADDQSADGATKEAFTPSPAIAQAVTVPGSGCSAKSMTMLREAGSNARGV